MKDQNKLNLLNFGAARKVTKAVKASSKDVAGYAKKKAEDAVNAHSASPWRSAARGAADAGKLRCVGTSTFTSKSWTAMMAYLMVSLLNDTTCPTLVTTRCHGCKR